MAAGRFLFTGFTILMFGVSAHADHANFSQFANWVEGIATGSGTVISMSATTPDGIPCEVYVTRRPFDGTFYLSMGVGTELQSKDAASEKNNYFGAFITPDADLQFSSQAIDLNYSGGYIEGNRGHNNVDLELHIEMDESGNPLRARGKSTLQPKEQICLIVSLVS